MTQIIPALLAFMTCTCFYFLRNNTQKKVIVWLLYIFLFAVSIYLFVDKLLYRYNNPAVWDFTSFYLWGKVGASGHNFYIPQYSQEIYNTLQLPALNYDTFIADIVNVGFLYPPPTMFYFTPLSFLSYQSALIIWTIFNLIFLFASIKITYDLFFKKDGLKGLILTVILFFILSSVRSTIFFSQTNFILLYLLLLMKKHADSKYAGIFLTLAMFTKPFMVVFFFYFTVNKNWRAIYYFLGSTIMVLAVTAATFGTDIFYSYVFYNPTKRLPQGAFLEDINQSLHSVLLRAKLITFDKSIVFILIATILFTAAMIYIYYLKKRARYDSIWVILLLTALILYPGTLGYYGVLLLFVIFLILEAEYKSIYRQYINISIVAAAYWLSVEHLFAANLFLLSVTVLKNESDYIFKKMTLLNS